MRLLKIQHCSHMFGTGIYMLQLLCPICWICDLACMSADTPIALCFSRVRLAHVRRSVCLSACNFWFMQVFDAGSRTLLRQLKAHKRAAHVAHFSPDRMHVLSAADDTTVLWTTVASIAVHVHSCFVCSVAVLMHSCSHQPAICSMPSCVAHFCKHHQFILAEAVSRSQG